MKHRAFFFLVALAALGEEEGSLGRKTPSILAKTAGAIKKTPDEFNVEDFLKLFAPDLPRERAEFAARSQVLAATTCWSRPCVGS
jgi:hypothetical protein